MATPQGPGIVLTNMSAERCAYFFYDNFWYGSGKPLNSVSLESSQSQLVDLLVTFKGRVQRETRIPATWVEFQIKAYNDGAAHGDISVQQGYDGATTIASTDRSNRLNGFADDIMNGVPDGACQVRADGVRCIEGTMGNWLGGPNQAAIDWRHRRIGQKRAYIQGRSGTDDVASSNNCLAVNMY